MQRRYDADTVTKALTLIMLECDQHKLCKGCALFYNNDCALNRPPAHYEIGEIVAHLLHIK